MVIGSNAQLVRFSYVQVFEPKAMEGFGGGEPKYSVMVLIDKTHKELVAKVTKAIQDTMARGIEKGMYNKALTSNPAFKKCLRDGDQYAAEVDDGSRDACKGMMFFNASTNVANPPAVVDQYANPILDKNKFYSGCYGLVDVNFYPFKHGSGGIAAGLNSLMFKKDGQRLDGRTPATEAFKDFTEEEGEDSDADGQLM